MKQFLLHAIIGFKIEHFYLQHASDVIVWWQGVEHVGIKNRHTWRDDMFQHIFLKQWIRMQLHTCKSNKTLNKPCNNNDKNRNCEFSNYCWLLPLVVCDWMRKWANWVLGKSPSLFGTAVQKQPMNFEFHNMSSCFMPIQIQDHYMAHASMMCVSTICWCAFCEWTVMRRLGSYGHWCQFFLFVLSPDRWCYPTVGGEVEKTEHSCVFFPAKTGQCTLKQTEQ